MSRRTNVCCLYYWNSVHAHTTHSTIRTTRRRRMVSGDAVPLKDCIDGRHIGNHVGDLFYCLLYGLIAMFLVLTYNNVCVG